MNGEPHIGFAMEAVEADAIARYQRLLGKETFFLTGTDEHGSKLAETAKEQGLKPQELCDQNSAKFKELTQILNLSNDDFIRTSDQKRHWPAVQKLWQKLVEKGDIYKGEYEGLYCVGCESFITEKELVDGKCPHHDKEPEKVSEENYFFKLSKYSKQVADLIRSKKLNIVPDFRANEILYLCDQGLKDVSFSRPREVLNWGVPVPDDDSQVMYVWCDALTNYISAIGYAEETEQFKKLWPCDCHVIGKDILRFHAAIWIGMLISAGIELPKSELVHGWIHTKGERMSKSKGNVISPFDLVDEYGVDAVRYYLLSEIPMGKDGDFTYARFEEKYVADLANSLGNLVNRVIVMTQKYFDSVVPEAKISPEIKKIQDEALKKYHQEMEGYMLHKGAGKAFSLVHFANKYIDEKAPWTLAKEGKDEELKSVLFNLLQLVSQVAVLLIPFIPQSIEKIFQQLDLPVPPTFADFKLVPPGHKLGSAEPIFPRLEKKE